jgi:hypothetical protein
MCALQLVLLLIVQLSIQTSSLFLYRSSSTSITQVKHRGSYSRHYHDTSRVARSATTPSIKERDITSPEEAPAADPVHQILKGRHKWLGGAYHSDDGCVYGIPSHSGHVICLSPKVGSSSSHDEDDAYTINFLPLPSAIATPKKDKSHQFKWLRGIIANDTLFGIPAWFDGVLAVDLAAWRRWREENSECCAIVSDESLSQNMVSILPLPDMRQDAGNDYDAMHNKRWMWHGAALNANKTAIYCIPSNADRVLKVDLISMSTSYLPVPTSTTAPLSLSNKWYGGLLGEDNAIYGVPYAAGSVLRIDANFDTVSLLGDYGTNRYNWHGGILAKGSIYAFPAHAEAVLKIDTAVGLNGDERLSTLPIQRAEYDLDGVTRYKWLGGSMGADGNVVSFNVCIDVYANIT